MCVMQTTAAATGAASAPGQVTTVSNLIGGQWKNSSTTRFGDAFNPSTGRVIARVPFCTAAEADEVVKVAAEALPKWAETPVVERARIMFRFRSLIEAKFDELAHL